MPKIIRFFALISSLAIGISCDSPMDTLTGPQPDEPATVTNKADDGASFENGGSPILASLDGDQHAVSYTGTFQDLTIPMNPTVVEVTFTLNGGDGGYARVHDSLFGTNYVVKANGGAGASATATFEVGSGSGQIPHGSTVRFIVGGQGSNGNSGGVLGAGFDYGGGGGGTGVLVRFPTAASFVPLAVAGGGAGAYQGMVAYSSVDHEPGQGGRAGTSGGTGTGDLGQGAGGSGGSGGESNPALGSFGGGGGGAFGSGQGVDCVGIGGTFEAGEGGVGGQTGGYGGNSEGCLNFTWRNGGFGYGGGGAGTGAGGGGGGYSGGGVGGTTGRGGGGGSFVASDATQGSISPGGSISSPAHGAATYQFTLNAPPLVSCKNHTLILDANGQAALLASDVTQSASDPEGGVLQFSLDRSNFDCGDVGTNSVTLTVTDDVGQTASCVAEVTVIDDSRPVITSVTADPATLWPADHKMRSVLVTTTSSDNCSGTSCRVVAVSSNEPSNGTGDGNTETDWDILSDDMVGLRAERSGTRADRVYTITVECTDASGNKSQSTTSVTVGHDLRVPDAE